MSALPPQSRFVLRRRILFHETDLAGIVHFSNFFRLMEEVEHAFFRSLGHSIHPDQRQAEPIRQGWPRVSAKCDFHAPLFFEEEIEIELLVLEVRQRSIRYRIQFWKNPDSPPDKRLRAATGELAVVRVQADRAAGTMQAVAIPEEIRALLVPAENLAD